jgi:hypothetical protein
VTPGGSGTYKRVDMEIAAPTPPDASSKSGRNVTLYSQEQAVRARARPLETSGYAAKEGF